MSRKIVVALGGNAILSSDPSAQAQQEALVETAKHLVKLIKNGDDLIITHGNGPQVGNLLLQHLAANSEKNPAFPLDSLVAMTEGSIGYWLQNALQNALREEGIEKEGLLGIFKGGLTASSAGICGALVFGYLSSLVFQPKLKE